MARIVPDGWREVSAAGAARRQIETLALLARGLPDGYTVYHAVHWTNIEHGFSIYGDIDFAIVNAAGDLLLVEQQSGFLDETPDGLCKKYPDRVVNVPARIGRQVATLRGRLVKRPQLENVRVEYLFYCPDYTVRHPETAGIAAERIVDAGERDRLCAIIQLALPPAPGHPRAQSVRRFLDDVLQLEPDANALIGQARELVTRIAGGLASWARRLEFAPFRLRVIGTAGSGKTQLALAEYRAALEAGRRPLYVCFNRPLADHFAGIAPAGGLACTFHTLCERVLQAAGQTVDFSRPGAFDGLVERAAAQPLPDALRFDTVIVDEGQDFPQAWRDLVLRHAAGGPGTRAIWLEDPMQNLYDRPPVELPGWVALRAEGNYRSPRSVVALLQGLLPGDARVEPRGPIASGGVEIMVYDGEEEMIAHTKRAISQCLAAGFKRADIAVVTFHGREHSALLAQPQLGPHALRAFTGRYDLFGKPEFSAGDVLVESVYRFKGQSAAAVVFTEIDFEQMDARAARKLFVGATRAMIRLVLVLSRRAAAQWLPDLHEAPR
ncbi:ATP-dependent helicase [Pigmentiphaga soli]|uniref:DNA 3'-5' helicase II n=1 Tax=Pigmentiphaga soli TaxID=1007095 RepID=A0ABP8GHP9_9BURK